MNRITVVIVSLLAILVAATLVPIYQRSRDDRSFKSVSLESTKTATRANYLADSCKGYNLLVFDAREEIRYEIGARLEDLAIGLFDRSNEHASSAQALIEAARLCGGYNLVNLGLEATDLAVIGMIRP